jgi:hypothetical protein
LAAAEMDDADSPSAADFGRSGAGFPVFSAKPNRRLPTTGFYSETGL